MYLSRKDKYIYDMIKNELGYTSEHNFHINQDFNFNKSKKTDKKICYIHEKFLYMQACVK